MKITVHGATGAQGGPVAAVLRDAGHDVVGISRNALANQQGLVVADLTNQASLESAYASADAVFLHLPIPHRPEDPAEWALSVLGALTTSDVRRVVLSTSGVSLDNAGPHPMLQQMLAATQSLYAGLDGTVDSVVALAPRLFLENLLLPFVASGVTDDGVLAYPFASDKPISWISHGDVAAVAALAVESTTPPGVYDLGHAPITGDQLAAAIGAAMGAEVRYEAIAPEEFARRATQLLGPDTATGVGQLYSAYANDPTRAVSAENPQLGQETRSTIEQWASLHFGQVQANAEGLP